MSKLSMFVPDLSIVHQGEMEEVETMENLNKNVEVIVDDYHCPSLLVEEETTGEVFFIKSGSKCHFVKYQDEATRNVAICNHKAYGTFMVSAVFVHPLK